MTSGLNNRTYLPLAPIFRLFACCLLPLTVLLARGLAQEPPAARPQTIRVNVERVNVGVIVTDAHGRFVEGLTREKFHVFDNGVEQPITDFASVREPGQVLLLVEAGPAVYLLQDTHLFVADALLDGLSPRDSVAIARYSDVPLALLNFTTDKRAAQSALEQLQFNLGFGQLNLTSSLTTVLGWLTRVPGKKTIVLLSTGVDTSQDTTIPALLRTGDVRILCISMSGPLRPGTPVGKRKVQQTTPPFEEADARLRAIAEATGGHAYFPENTRAFQETYRQIAEIVRHEYSLAFEPPARDGSLHAITVKVDLSNASGSGKTPDYRVDHRKAYMAPKTPS